MGLNLGTGGTWTFWTQPEAKVFQQTLADASQLRYVLVGLFHRTGTACETSVGHRCDELHITGFLVGHW